CPATPASRCPSSNVWRSTHGASSCSGGPPWVRSSAPDAWAPSVCASRPEMRRASTSTYGRSAASVGSMWSPLAEQRRNLAERGGAVPYDRGAARVWPFGSLAAGRPQDRRSDIDLAVEGLPQAMVDSALAAVEHASGCHVDVISLDARLPIQLRAQALRNR